MKNILILILGCFLYTACSFNNEIEVSKDSNTIQDTVKNVEQATTDIQKYSDIGFQYATSTKQTLGKNLIAAITEGGTVHALNFCNVQAIPLTDSMSAFHNATIKRASDKPRNPNNAANKEELKQIKHFKSLVANGKTGKEIQPNVKMEGDIVHFYYPILTNNMCLQCHGSKNKNIKPETLTQLADLYPEDQATGYRDNEVRGIWSIVFEK